MQINKLIPSLKHTSVSFDDGIVCGVMIIFSHKEKKMYIGYRSNLYMGVNSTLSSLRNGRHSNQRLQNAYNDGKIEIYTFPTDTVGEALDLKNSIVDEFARTDVFFNVYGHNHTARIQHQLNTHVPRKSRKVLVQGVLYETKKAAAVVFGLSESTVAYRIKSPNYPKWKEAE